jgi:hypothetical protein
MDVPTDTGFAQQCAETTKTIGILTAFTAVLISIFMFSPVSNLLVAASLGKVIIIALLMYIIYVNVLQTVFCQQVFNVNFYEVDLNQAKLNTIGGHIFTITLIVLLYSVASNLLSPLFGGSSQQVSEMPYSSNPSGYNQ